MNIFSPGWVWRLIHWVIIFNFLVQIGYASYMVFFVVTPPEGTGPLFAAAHSFPFEKMVTRRLYATECWIAISGLAIYLGITEIGPRLRDAR
ncbi:MAG: hypothetical protein ACPGQS_09570 [Bradymonadia bacterium]